VALDQARCIDAPFRHWVIDDAVSPSLVDAINRDWPENDDPRWRKEDGRNNRKWSMPAQDGAAARLYRALQTPSFCARVAALIGEPKVEADTTQFGGGLHAIPPTGFLKMHRDFRYLPDGRKRVANLLIYLNDDWHQGYGGALRLQFGKVVEYLPTAGRAVLFRTDIPGVHGHPDPLTCPPDRMRRSLAVYYYTAEQGVHDKTVYQK
jgi:Rps23 Pro-64 3,4-dihydroxylase Tpa1-like proline 4-hydroxylase